MYCSRRTPYAYIILLIIILTWKNVIVQLHATSSVSVSRSTDNIQKEIPAAACKTWLFEAKHTGIGVECRDYQVTLLWWDDAANQRGKPIDSQVRVTAWKHRPKCRIHAPHLFLHLHLIGLLAVKLLQRVEAFCELARNRTQNPTSNNPISRSAPLESTPYIQFSRQTRHSSRPSWPFWNQRELPSNQNKFPTH